MTRITICGLSAGNIAPSRQLNRQETIARIPNVETENLIGGAMYHDAQFDDARLALALARTAADHDAVLINYMSVTSLTKQNACVVVATACTFRPTARAKSM